LILAVKALSIKACITACYQMQLKLSERSFSDTSLKKTAIKNIKPRFYSNEHLPLHVIKTSAKKKL